VRGGDAAWEPNSRAGRGPVQPRCHKEGDNGEKRAAKEGKEGEGQRSGARKTVQVTDKSGTPGSGWRKESGEAGEKHWGGGQTGRKGYGWKEGRGRS
jgi:hypothetical protein